MSKLNLSLFLLFSPIAFVAAHGIGPGFLGSPEAVRALAPVRPQHAQRSNNFLDSFETEDVIFPGTLLTARAEKNLKLNCGAVNGSCPAGYWFVSLRNHHLVKGANENPVVQLEVGGKNIFLSELENVSC